MTGTPELRSHRSPLSRTTRAPVERLGVIVVQDLVDSIVTGQVAQGEALPPEGLLIEEFGVSRTVIRESIQRIQEKGLVTVAQGRATRVAPLAQWNLLDPIVIAALVAHDDSLGILDEVAAMRVALEAQMVARVAASRTPEGIARLREGLDATRAVIDDVPAFRAADVAWHSILMDLSGSRLAASAARTLARAAGESDRYHGTMGSRDFAVTLDEHRDILDAIDRGDPDGAAAAMRHHIEQAWARRRP